MSIDIDFEPLSEPAIAAMDTALLTEPGGAMRCLPAATLNAFDRRALRKWAHARGRYLLPTAELTSWLANELGLIGEAHLEIGAGMGDLGLALGLRMTDSGVQQRADMQLLYGLIGAATTKPPKNVERLDAISAAKKYKPHTILAAWVTQRFQHGDEHAQRGSCVYGVDERHLLNLCKRYVLIGNHAVHGDKRIMDTPHQVLTPPGLVSRARLPELDAVWIWER